MRGKRLVGSSIVVAFLLILFTEVYYREYCFRVDINTGDIRYGVFCPTTISLSAGRREAIIAMSGGNTTSREWLRLPIRMGGKVHVSRCYDCFALCADLYYYDSTLAGSAFSDLLASIQASKHCSLSIRIRNEIGYCRKRPDGVYVFPELVEKD